MSAKTEQILRRLTSSIREGGREKTSAYDTSATVRRVEDGVAWVHIPGGVDETPVKLTINAKPGDVVQVRVSGGRATLTGNASAPPTDDTTATKAVTQIGAVSKVVKTVQGVAEKAARIAGNTAQYFWHTESGTDTGAHITEIPQKDFEADPQNSGGNLLLRSNGIAIRDGLVELAMFAANLMRIFGGGWATEVTDDGFRVYDETTTRELKIAITATGLAFFDAGGIKCAEIQYLTPGGGVMINNIVTQEQLKLASNGFSVLDHQGRGMYMQGEDVTVTGQVSCTHLQSANVQCGYALLAGAANVVRTENVVFDTPFTVDPHVVVTPYTAYPQNASVGLSNITRTGFTINLVYATTTTINVQWVAIGM